MSNKEVIDKEKDPFYIDPEKMVTYEDMLNGRFPMDCDEYGDYDDEQHGYDDYDELDELDELHTGEDFIDRPPYPMLKNHRPTYYSKSSEEFNNWSNVLNKVVSRNNELKELSKNEWTLPPYIENEVIENSEPLKLNRGPMYSNQNSNQKETTPNLDKDMYCLDGEDEDDDDISELDTINIMDDLFLYCKKLEASHRKLKKEVKSMKSMTQTIHYKLLREISNMTFELERLKRNVSPYFSSIDYNESYNNTEMKLDDI